MRKGEGKLIGGEGEQVAKFTHQVRFCQALGSKRDGGLTACELANEAALLGIEAQFEHLVAQFRAKTSSHNSPGRAARWRECAETSGRWPVRQRRA